MTMTECWQSIRENGILPVKNPDSEITHGEHGNVVILVTERPIVYECVENPLQGSKIWNSKFMQSRINVICKY